MRPSSFVPRVAVAAVLCLVLSSLSLLGQQKRPPRDPAVDVVTAFFQYHLKHGMAFTRSNVAKRRKWLTPDLYNALLYELQREAEHHKAAPDDAPFFEGDPFTASQEYPDAFRIGKSSDTRVITRSGDSVGVEVVLITNDRKSKSRTERTIGVVVIGHEGRWLIGNIGDADGNDLLALLKRKEY